MFVDITGPVFLINITPRQATWSLVHAAPANMKASFMKGPEFNKNNNPLIIGLHLVPFGCGYS